MKRKKVNMKQLEKFVLSEYKKMGIYYKFIDGEYRIIPKPKKEGKK